IVSLLYEVVGTPSCGDDRDDIIAQYKAFNVIDIVTGLSFIPTCDDFTHTAHTVFFSFNELNVDNLSNWALLRTPLLEHVSSGYGIDKWRTEFGGQRTINSAYRTPEHNASLYPPGSPSSRHLFGDAADFNNQSGTLQEWTAMYQAAQRSHPRYIEP